MFRGFYTAASGMLSQQRRAEILTNNLANVNTPGYKADQLSLRAFPEMLISRIHSGTTKKSGGKRMMFPVGTVNTGVYVQDATPDFRQGDLRKTELPTDFALQNIAMPANEEGISGTVFFILQNPGGGVQYTRNGNFTLDSRGFLTTATGYYVLDINGNPVQLENDGFRLTEDGYIEQNGAVVARLGIAFSENPNLLRKTGAGLYEPEEGELPSAYDAGPELAFALKQGYVERSNVDAARTMTELLAAYRSFEANQKVLQAYDRSMDKAVNEIGKV